MLKILTIVLTTSISVFVIAVLFGYFNFYTFLQWITPVLLLAILCGTRTLTNLYPRNALNLLPRPLIDQFLFGNHFSVDNSKIVWSSNDSKDPLTVGRVVQFYIELRTRNGNPYTLYEKHHLHVAVVVDTTVIPFLLDWSGSRSSVSVSFNAHMAGKYRINIRVQTSCFQPIVRTIHPGPAVPSGIELQSGSSLLVGVNEQPVRVLLVAHDCYGNPCLADAELTRRLSVLMNDAPVTYNLWQASETSYTVALTPWQTGAFSLSVGLDRNSVASTKVTLISLREDEWSWVNDMVPQLHEKTFGIRLLRGDRSAKQARCLISARQIKIYDYHFKLIPRTLRSFRVTRQTQLLPDTGDATEQLDLMVIDDGIGSPLRIGCEKRQMLMAMFAKMLEREAHTLRTFQERSKYFFAKLEKQNAPKRDDKVVLHIDRTNLLETSVAELKKLSAKDWLKSFMVTFSGEAAADYGGPRREWVTLLAKELFSPELGLFVPLTNDPRSPLHPAECRSSLTSNQKRLVRIAGRLVGKCLCERLHLPVRLSRALLARVAGLDITYRHFESDDPEFYRTKVHFILNNDVASLELVFSEEIFDDKGRLVRVEELMPGGASTVVTEVNKREYLQALARYRLMTRCQKLTEKFIEGVHEIVSERLLATFDEAELELLLCGMDDIGVDDLKHNCFIRESSVEFDKVMNWFWAIVAGFSREEMARLLQFTTGSAQLPHGGFAELQPAFTITRSPAAHNSLPTAHTCFHQLCFPLYDSPQRLQEALQIALHEGSEGFGFI